MQTTLRLYNTLTRQKEEFRPIHPPFVGIYVCGPTLYSDAHIGNCRTYVSFDLIWRYLLHLGYKVRYVRNITDVGHLQDENAETGEDRVGRQARLKQLEPMEIVQRYATGFREVMAMLNTLPPSIEPTASGHIIEQIEMTQKIIGRGYGYIVDGNVYFDVEKYAKDHDYGILSGRTLDDQLNNTRELEGQEEKKGRLDFALWKKATPEHIMRWPSPWGEGFPGWHIECSAMSRKYLGETFDIHGGGMDLIPTHHTNEIAQSVGCCEAKPVKYWVHTNMLTLNGQKMSRSLGNVFLPVELFTGMQLAEDSPSGTPSQARFKGKHPLFEKAYSPMAVRFFMLQTHYRSTLDFSNEALQASEKGFTRLMQGLKTLDELKPGSTSTVNIQEWVEGCYTAMNDDFNSPVLIAQLFDAVTIINNCKDGRDALFAEHLETFKKYFRVFVIDVLGLKPEADTSGNTEVIDNLMKLVVEMRQEARATKNFALSDKIRDHLQQAGVLLKDGKDGTTWQIQ